MHDLIVVGVPLLAIFAGILLNRNDIKELRGEIGGLRGELRGEIGGLRAEMNSRFDSIQSDLRQFYHLTGKLEGRMDAIEKQRS